MQITTKAQAKTIVSSLRREVKALGKAPGTLTHNDCLTLMAKALGFPNWNAWEATLADAPAEKIAKAGADAPKYPLVNKGDFDFVSRKEDGKPFSGMFNELEGTSEVILGTTGVMSATRGNTDSKEDLLVEYDGTGTDVDWNSQETQKNKAGYMVWLDPDGNTYSGAQVVLTPEDCADPYEDEELPVRPKLIQAFIDYIAENKVAAHKLSGDFSAIAEVLGFALTQKEEEVLAKQLAV
jgi:hypothetical protein